MNGKQASAIGGLAAGLMISLAMVWGAGGSAPQDPG